MIHNSHDNVNISFNETLSILHYAKMSSSKDVDLYHIFFYNKYFKEKINLLFKKFSCQKSHKRKRIKRRKSRKLKKADEIRIKNLDRKLGTIKHTIYEFILIELIYAFFEGKEEKKSFHYYTLSRLLTYKIMGMNTLLESDIIHILKVYEDTIQKKKLIKNNKERSKFKH